MRNEVAIARSITVLAVLGVIAALYFAKAVFVPLALAILLTFLLAPAVRMLRSWGLPKPPAVVLVVAFAFTVILGIGALVGQQVTKLAQNLPVYQYNIEEKIRSAREFAGGGMLERISNFLGDLTEASGNAQRRSRDHGCVGRFAVQELLRFSATSRQIMPRILIDARSRAASISE